MKTPNHILMFIVVAATTLSGGTAQAQTRGVIVTSTRSPGFEQAVVAALEARIGASSRYELTTLLKAELQASVNCMDMADLAHNITGGFCAYSLTYYPEKLGGLSAVLSGPALTSGSNPAETAETIFQKFVKYSSEQDLKAILKAMVESIETYNLLKAYR